MPTQTLLWILLCSTTPTTVIHTISPTNVHTRSPASSLLEITYCYVFEKLGALEGYSGIILRIIGPKSIIKMIIYIILA